MDLLLKIPRLPLSLYTSSGKRRINCSMCNCQLIACPLPGVKAKAILYSLLSHDDPQLQADFSTFTTATDSPTKSPSPSADSVPTDQFTADPDKNSAISGNASLL